ncbi:MAG: 4Fe-4S dicluster domain-containing protein [Candidatus Omnitrophica bacterium]|nr:4Fe-4S dicluster domain-containing protein [Candidatus Omnitrophota bacterium]
MIVVDIDRCLGCKSCELACGVEHSESKELHKAIVEYPTPASRVKVEASEDLSIPLACRQCEDAPCVKVCPTKALERTSQEEPVLINSELCIGCKWCILVCPFGVIRMDKTGKAILKCDMCFKRLLLGKIPSCVLACPTKALQFKSLDEVTAEKRKDYLTKFIKDGKYINETG